MARRKNEKPIHDDCWNLIGVWGTNQVKCEKLGQVVHCRNCEVFSEAGRNALEKRPPSGYIVQWQNEIRHQQDYEDKEVVSGMIFRLAEEWYSIVSRNINEVADWRAIHRVPHNSNKYIAGIVNIGGEINVCFSLAELLGCDEIRIEDNVYQRLLVIKSHDQRFIFPVSEVLGIVKYNKNSILPPPSTLDKHRKSYLKGIYIYNNNQVGILDVDNVCTAFEGFPV